VLLGLSKTMPDSCGHGLGGTLRIELGQEALP
jgi:hypothetical protein